MPSNVNTAWKNDLYPLVSKQFDYSYNNRMNLLRQIVTEQDDKSIDVRIEGMGGYGELPDYDGNQKRGFVTILENNEKAGMITITRRKANIDKSGEAKKAGTRAAHSASMTVYMAILRTLGRAFNPAYQGGDGKPWAATDHPVASKGDANGRSIADPDAGTFSNLVNVPLSTKAITDIQAMANRFVTPDGLAFTSDFSGNGLLLVSAELEGKAKELCGGEGTKLIPEKLPESAENGANPIYGMKYLVVSGGADGFSGKQWAICDRDLLKEIFILNYIERPTVLRNKLDDPLIDAYVPYVDFGIAFGDARPIIFSNGNS